MKILVTGAAGFIGSSLSEALIREGHQVIGVDNFDSFYSEDIKEKNLRSLRENPNFRLYRLDITDLASLSEIFSKNAIELVVHLAARAGVRPSISNPIGYYDVNLRGTLNLLELMKATGCRRMIFASSSSVYGNSRKVPFSEQDNVDYPISPYAATKKSGELLCHTYHHLYGFDIFCLRYFTVYGPRQRPDLAIHKFSRLIMERKPVPFYGDGSTERDYTYIDDIVDGTISAIYHLNGFEIFNLGESNTISLARMVSTLEEALGRRAIIQKLPMQPGDVVKTFADISKARARINYNPKVPFDLGIKRFISWLRGNINNDTVVRQCNLQERYPT